MTITLNTASDATAAALFQAGAAVDELGFIKAQIAELEQKEKALTEALKATGLTEFKGGFYDCTISRTDRESVDAKKLRADLGEDLIAPYVRSTPVVTLKVTAKK